MSSKKPRRCKNPTKKCLKIKIHAYMISAAEPICPDDQSWWNEGNRDGAGAAGAAG